MARVPGLVPVQQDNSRPTQNAGRGRPNSQPSEGIARLGAVASPVDTFIRTTQEDSGATAFTQLAESLSGLAPVLGEFLKKDPEDSAAAARKLVLTEGRDAIAEQIAAGNTPAALQNVHGQRVWGEERANADAAELVRRYNDEFDKDNGDLEALIKEVTGGTLEAYGSDRAFSEVYTKAILGPLDRLRGSHGDHTSTKIATERRDNVFGAWSGRVENMTADGVAPAAIAASLFSDIKGNKDYYMLPERDQKELILTIADREATRGNFDVAKALLRHEAGGQGSDLMSDAELAGKATGLYARIEDDQSRAATAAVADDAEAQLREEALAAMEDGNLSAITDAVIPDKSGGTKTVTAEAIRKQASQDLITKVAEEAATRGLMPEGAALLEKQRFVGNGIQHPTWFNTMEAGATTNSINNITTDNLPSASVQGFTTFLDLYRDSPQYLSKFLSQDAMEFYETAAILYESGRYESPDAALRSAAISKTEVNPDARVSNLQYQQLDEAVSGVVGDTGSSWYNPFSWGERPAANGMDTRKWISKRADILMRNGLPPEEAVKAAAESYSKSHVAVLGTYVKLSKDLPPDFAPLVDEYVAGVAVKLGEDVGNLTIRELGNGTGGYYITDRNTYEPVVDEQGDLLTFTFKDLDHMRNQKRDLATTDTVRNYNNTQEDRLATQASLHENYLKYGGDPEKSPFKEAYDAYQKLHPKTGLEAKKPIAFGGKGYRGGSND